MLNTSKTFLFLAMLLIATQTVLAQPSPTTVDPSAKKSDVTAVVDILKEMRKDDAQFRSKVLGTLDTMQKDIVAIKGDITTIKGDIVVIKGDIVLIKADQAAMKADIVLIKADQAAMNARLTLLEKEFEKAKANNQVINITVQPTATYVPPTVYIDRPVFYYYAPTQAYYGYYGGHWYNYSPSYQTYYYYPTYVNSSYSSYYAYSSYASYRGYAGVPYRARWWRY